MRRQRIVVFAGLLAIIALASLGWALLRPRPSMVVQVLPTPTIGPKPRPGYTPVPADQISPLVIQRIPERGAELPADGVVELVFDRPMDQASVAAAWTVAPAVAGKLEWVDTRTVRFKPSQPLAHASTYDVVLKQDARAADGASLNSAYQFRFATAGYLEVGQTIPANETQDVEADTVITVMFNRPVVPLVTSGDQSALPQPLLFDPPLKGAGEWLNTSVYVFKPAAPLAGGTTYAARVDGKLADIDGNPLQAEHSWRFSTIAPQVLFSQPERDAKLVSVEPVITLSFNQPINQASAEQSFQLQDAAGGKIAGELRVLSETLVFTPSEQLKFDQRYEVVVAAGLQSLSGGAGMAAEWRQAFQTVPLPRILRTEPANGEQAAQPYSSFTIYFNAPINPDTVMANLTMTPPFSPTQVYTYFNSYDNSFVLAYDVKPSTDYRVQLGPDIADPYGNLTGQSLDVAYRTSALPPAVNLFAPSPIGTYSASLPARVGLSSVNLDTAKLTLYSIELDLLKKPQWEWDSQIPSAARVVRSWSVPLKTPLNERRLAAVDLVEGGGKLAPGAYLVALDQPDSQQPQTHVLVVSELSLTLKGGERDALAWATNNVSGEPVAGVAIEFIDNRGISLGTVATDAQGIATLKLTRTEDEGLIAIAREPLAAMSLGWSTSSPLWEMGISASTNLPELTAHIYTERTIYRPGDQVQFKGIVRAENDVKFSLPTAVRQAEITISDANGQEVYRETNPFNANGTFEGTLKLPQGAALGSYAISVAAGDTGFSAMFQVAAYRAPEFQVTVTPAAKELVRGTASSVTVDASYFFGGPVANVPINWNILSSNHDFSPEWAERFQFGANDDPWYCGRCWWRTPAPAAPLLSGAGTTDAQGKLVINLPAELKNSAGAPITSSLDLLVEATATGKDNQVISGRDTVVVHRADSYIGLAARSYVAKANEEQIIDVVTASADGQRLANQAMELEIFKVSWNNRFVQQGGGGYWESIQTRASVLRQPLTTDATASGAFRWTPAEAGSYQVVATARDKGGRDIRSATFTWVSGDTFTPWLRDNNDSITLIADKTSYKPGETATILIPSPFQGPHLALISVERGGVLSYEVRRLTSNSGVYQLKLEASHAPNVYVSVVLLAPPAATGQAGAQVAEYKLGVLPLAVAADPQTLNVKITPESAEALPGQKLRYDVEVTDQAGRPAVAELSLDLVDKAVLSLAPRPANAVLETFYGRRPLGIATASSIALSAERFQAEFAKELERQEEREKDAPRGGAQPQESASRAGGYAPPAADAAAPAPTARLTAGEAQLFEAANQAPTAAPTIRGEFADTAFWQAVVSTDASGRASVTVKLPDNLTTWVMRGVAATADTRVGEGSSEIVATRPLLIRPVTPRFFVVNDQVDLAANVSNNTDGALKVEVSLATTGLTLSSPQTQTVEIAANSEANLTWQVVAQDVEQADLVFTAISGAYSDASRPRLATGPDGTLEVQRYSVPEIVGTGGQLTEAGNRTEAIGLPTNVDPRSGELTVRIDPSLAAGMRDTLEYLEEVDYDSIEATVSSFLPNVATARALKKLGIANQELEAKLPAQIETALGKLKLAQHEDGGWGWWADDDSNPHVSAYAVYGLIRARDSGWTVDEQMLSRGLEYLATNLVATSALNTADKANQQAWLLYVLAEGGTIRKDNLGELFEAREKLASYARALLALSLAKSGVNPGDAQIKTLLVDLNNAAIVSATGAHWEEEAYDRWSMNTDTRSTAIILLAQAQLDPQNQLNPNVVRWLMVARRDGIWETSQESAWAVLALTDWMAVTGELDADYDYAVFVNDKEQASGHFGKADVGTPIVLKLAVKDLLIESGNRLSINRGAGPGRAYYSAHLRAFLPVEEVKALDRGVVVRRRYTLASCADGAKCPAVDSIKVGDVVRVDISITAPNDLYYVQLEDPIPAGAEIIDTGLATTSVLEQGPDLNRTRPAMPGIIDEAGGMERMVVDWYWGWWNWYSRSELRDDRVALFADYLPKGAYSYSYTIRATLPGSYHVIPTTAHEAYFPEVYGRGDGNLMTIAR